MNGLGQARATGRTRLARRGSGFTLVEVVVAMAIVAVAFTAMLGLHGRSLRLAAREQAHARALFLARSMLAEMELQGYPDVGTASGDFEARNPGEYPGWAWQSTVTDTPLPDTREVRVRVGPSDDPAAAAQLTLFLRGDRR